MTGDFEESRELPCPFCGRRVGVYIEHHEGGRVYTANSHDQDDEGEARGAGVCPGATQDEWDEAYGRYLEGVEDAALDHRIHDYMEGGAYDDDLD